MKNKAFIFDWSGTLSDNFHLFCKVCDLMFVELDKEPISPDEIRRNFTIPFMKFWNIYFPDLTLEKQCEMFDKYIHQVGEPELYDNVFNVVNFLHQSGYKIFILSGDPESKLFPEIDKSGLANLITKKIGGIHDKRDMLSYLVKEFSLDKNKTFYIGDTSGDVEAGKFAGLETIGISWGLQHKDALAKSNPDFLIDDIIEIKNILLL